MDRGQPQRVIEGAATMPVTLPALFLGHGTPMNAVSRNRFTEAWQRIGVHIGKPAAVLSISAHWYGRGTGVTVATALRTIHDFGGFPPELYQVQYPAPGDPALALKVQSLLAPERVTLDSAWGLDHGTWSVLRHVYPDADVPVVQLAIDATQPASFHHEIRRVLAPLREEGVLIMGSGNLVHNLRAYAWGQETREAYDWATRFEATARELMLAGDHRALIEYERLGADAHRSIPTPEHYLPLLYVLGTQRERESITFPVEGVDGGSISMLGVRVGNRESDADTARRGPSPLGS